MQDAAEEHFNELDMNLSTAFNFFVRQSLRERAIPFTITEITPNQETVNAMLEAKRIAKDPSVKNIKLLDDIIRILSRGEPLPAKNKDHALSGYWSIVL